MMSMMKMKIPKYFVKAEFFSLGHQLHVYDRNNHELGVIRQRLLTFLPAFEIEIGGRVRGEIRKQFSFFKPRYEIDYNGWRVEGDFLGWIMMYTMDAAVSSISLKNCFTGEIRILLISPIHRMNWRV